jgi:methionine-rich copper-binding protein CopC
MAKRLVLAALVLAGASMAPLPASALAVQTMSIAEGESFEFSPFAFEVRFSERVQLVSARLVDQEGRATPVDMSFYRARAQAFVIELPVLIPHGYRLSWKVRTPAGAEQQGSVGFLVKGCLDPRLAQGSTSAR